MPLAECYLVECYWPGVSAEMLAALAARTQEAASAMREQGRDLRFLGSIFVPAEETFFCLFDGSEADVRTVSNEAGVRYERILESLRIDGDEMTNDEQ